MMRWIRNLGIAVVILLIIGTLFVLIRRVSHAQEAQRAVEFTSNTAGKATVTDGPASEGQADNVAATDPKSRPTIADSDPSQPANNSAQPTVAKGSRNPGPFDHLNITQQFFTLKQLEPEDTAKTLRSLFGDIADGQGIVRIAANSSSKTIIISAPADSLVHIKATIEQLEDRAAILLAETEKRQQERMQRTQEAFQDARRNLSPSPETIDPSISSDDAKTSTSSFASKFLSAMTDQDAALDREARQLAEKVRATKGPDRDKLRVDLERLTEHHFAQRQKHRNQEIEDLGHRVAQMRVAHARREEQKAEILKRRIAELLGEDGELNWDDARQELPRDPQSTEPSTETVDPTSGQLQRT